MKFDFQGSVETQKNFNLTRMPRPKTRVFALKPAKTLKIPKNEV